MTYTESYRTLLADILVEVGPKEELIKRHEKLLDSYTLDDFCLHQAQAHLAGHLLNTTKPPLPETLFATTKRLPNCQHPLPVHQAEYAAILRLLGQNARADSLETWYEDQLDITSQDLSNLYQPIKSPPITTWWERPRYNPEEGFIHNEETALVGYRAWDRTILATTCGDETAMGAFRYLDVAVETFGPLTQGSFGIHNPYQHKATLNIDQGFSIEGIVATSQKPNGRWLEQTITYNNDELTIFVDDLACSTTPLLMAFFIKAPTCELEENTLKLCGDLGSLTLHFDNEPPDIVPLAGGPHSWGASHRATFPINGPCQWTIHP